MKTQLERKWWFIAFTNVVAAMAGLGVMEAADIATPYNAGQWLLFVCCVGVFQRVASGLIWLAFLGIAPGHKLLQDTK